MKYKDVKTMSDSELEREMELLNPLYALSKKRLRQREISKEQIKRIREEE